MGSTAGNSIASGTHVLPPVRSWRPRSLRTGGAPVELAYRHRRRTRADLWVLCDVSGSVADFAAFLLGLVAALNDQLPHTRAFCFVDGIDEVSELLAASA